MSLPHAILTALAERACSGAELARRFDRSIGYFWHATHQQIYRELARLEKSGWVQSVEAAVETGQLRRYKLLPKGRQQLRQWMLQPMQVESMRSEMLLRVRAESVLGPSGLEQELLRQIPLHEQTLSIYKEIEQRDFLGAETTSRQRSLQHAVLRAGLLREEAWLQWAHETLAILASAKD